MQNIPAIAVDDGVKLNVRLTPKAKKEGVTGVIKTADNVPFLKVSVTVVPEKGKANSALIKLLSKKLHLPKSSFSIISGMTDRNKIIHIKGDNQELLQLIKEKLEK